MIIFCTVNNEAYTPVQITPIILNSDIATAGAKIAEIAGHVRPSEVNDTVPKAMS